ncbi:substrate-binding domain-containing protein [Bdellovibrio bacteriovorus]|uniref:substrate-binding domain-containing protein n=1 Tax=Bdellovibrio TaxID=958 RepID=UPI0035A95913
MKIEGQVAMRKGFEEEITAFNKKGSDKIEVISYVAGEGRKGILNQVAQLDNVLKKPAQALVIQPTDNSALARGLQDANRLKIPVFAYDQYIVNGALTSFATSDNYSGGQDNGEYIDSLYNKDHEVRIVVFEYPRVSSTTDRVDGFFDALRKKNRKFSVLKRYEAVDPESGAKAAKDFLRDFPGKGSVDVIFTVNDGGGLSIVKALLEKKRHEIIHATFDGDPLSVENIRNKKLTVIDSAQFCAELGRETARSLISYFTKEKVPEKKLIPTFPVTEKTINSYPGWMGRPVQKVTRFEYADPGADLKVFRRPSSDEKNRTYLNIKIGVAPLCPYLCEKGPGVWGGYIYDILKEIAKAQGFTVELESIPNTRLVAALQARRVNYIIGPRYMVRYLPDIRIVGPNLGVSYTGALLSPEVKESLIDNEFVRNKKIVFADLGMESGHQLSIDDPSRAIKLTGSDVADRMTKMIRDRRVDLALGDYNVLRYSLLRKLNTGLQLHPTSLTGFNSLVLVSNPKEPEFGFLPQHLDTWFQGARSNGELEKILARYNLKDWKIFNR